MPFPKNFLTVAKTILKRLFRIYAHIYHQHFREVVNLGEEAHLKHVLQTLRLLRAGVQPDRKARAAAARGAYREAHLQRQIR